MICAEAELCNQHMKYYVEKMHWSFGQFMLRKKEKKIRDGNYINIWQTS